MQRRFIQILVGSVTAVLLITSGYVLGQSDSAPIHLFGSQDRLSPKENEAFRPFWETWRYLHQEFFDQPMDDVGLVEGAIEGMLATLDDPNTRYLSPEQESTARQAFQGNLEGIGAEVSTVDGAITVVAPYEGSPAEEAGLRIGDIIREADGIQLTGMSVMEAAGLVRGPAGTTVRLLIEREGERFDVAVVRGVISIPTVRGETLESGLAYVRLSRFGSDTADELDQVVRQLLDQDPLGLILDLRGNPGGGLTTAVKVADVFLDGGPILTERFGNGRENLFESTGDGAAQEIPMAVLIDQGSASASEVLAGAIRDRGRATLIGETSFGKGTVQNWQSLSNGGGLRITVARWFTPEGQWVHGEGLEPDIVISRSDDGEETNSDLQLEAAIRHLLNESLLETATD
jgi:carboxyl-terminal processing protease